MLIDFDENVVRLCLCDVLHIDVKVCLWMHLIKVL